MHLNVPNDKPIISYGAALAFALLPFSPNGGLTVAGMPLAASAFISFREERQSATDWLILVLLAFYTSFIIGFLFLYIAVFGLIAIDKIRKKPVFRQLTALGIISILHLFTMVRLLYLVYGPTDFVGNRSDRQFFVDESLFSSLISTFDCPEDISF